LSNVADGSVNWLDWNEVMKSQRKNGSLFNSPSITAAALVQKYDDKALQYLKFLVNTFGSAGVSVYIPLQKLCMGVHYCEMLNVIILV
jgi:ent-kaurene synthase